MKKRCLTAVSNYLTGGYAGAVQLTVRGSRHRLQQGKLSRKFHNQPMTTKERGLGAKDKLTRVTLLFMRMRCPIQLGAP